MNSNEKKEINNITNYINSGLKSNPEIKRDWSFEAGIRSNFAPLVKWALQRFMAPWLIKCLKKYTEAEFHEKMRNTYVIGGNMYSGFDFISDWKMNHPHKFRMFIEAARHSREYIVIDLNDQLIRLITILNQHGWTVYDYEKKGLYQTLQRLVDMIYSDIPISELINYLTI